MVLLVQLYRADVVNTPLERVSSIISVATYCKAVITNISHDSHTHDIELQRVFTLVLENSTVFGVFE